MRADSQPSPAVPAATDRVRHPPASQMFGASGGPPPQPQQPVVLHGDLHLTIHEARGLPNMDILSTLLRRLCLCPPTLPAATGRRPITRSASDAATDHHHHSHQPHGHRILPASDPYAAVVVPAGPAGGGVAVAVTLARTHVVRNSDAPVWDATLLLHLAHAAPGVELHVKDADPFGSDLIGTALIPAAAILGAAEKPIADAWVPLLRPDRRGTPKPTSAIRVSATFTPAAAQAAGCWRSPGTTGVPAYFPPRRGCDVRLYQDAHVAAGELGPGVAFEPGRCWEDLCMAVLGAQRLVYVAGWSVHITVRLVREDMSPEMKAKAAEIRELAGIAVEDMSLGDLLKFKSQEGVRVLLLIWDDKTSHDTFFLKMGGVMKTRDEETRKFFKHSSVMCVLSPRYPSSKLSIVKQKVVGTFFTHHQKCLLVDTPASATTRRITAFLGGIDLCAGRYDTPSHRLFRDLDAVFKDGDGQVYNPTFNNDERGPRQPWHDLHCRLEGPAAFDVLTNFEQRWRKATRLRQWFSRGRPHRKEHHHDDALLELSRISWILTPNPSSKSADDEDADDGARALHVMPDDDPGTWHAQVFRSVDSGSVRGFPRPWDTQETSRRHLLCDTNLVEQSIHTAYVRAIRAADRFIYIENQYFIGSSFAWPSYRTAGAGNLVPMEIALKVAAKVRARQPFTVYILIPMWPEGDPSSGPAQEILLWQNQTMEMMYRLIRAEMDAVGLKDAHPQQYLNFYCLGNREPPEVAGDGDGDGSRSADDDPTRTSPAEKARRHRRFMVYVHSKGMIVDDEYVIVGSANINQRSLAGSRDTEIAVGGYQPHHVAAPARGKVFGYRMSLWEEHLGGAALRRHPELQRPESPECVRLVNDIARSNWARYVDDGDGRRAGPLQGHLMSYPVRVGADGRVTALPGHVTFPDVGGRVLGSSNNLPDYLTM